MPDVQICKETVIKANWTVFYRETKQGQLRMNKDKFDIFCYYLIHKVRNV